MNPLDHCRCGHDVALLADFLQSNTVFKQNAGEPRALIISRRSINRKRTATTIVAIADDRDIDIV